MKGCFIKSCHQPISCFPPLSQPDGRHGLIAPAFCNLAEAQSRHPAAAPQHPLRRCMVAFLVAGQPCATILQLPPSTTQPTAAASELVSMNNRTFSSHLHGTCCCQIAHGMQWLQVCQCWSPDTDLLQMRPAVDSICACLRQLLVLIPALCISHLHSAHIQALYLQLRSERDKLAQASCCGMLASRRI